MASRALGFWENETTSQRFSNAADVPKRQGKSCWWCGTPLHENWGSAKRTWRRVRKAGAGRGRPPRAHELNGRLCNTSARVRPKWGRHVEEDQAPPIPLPGDRRSWPSASHQANPQATLTVKPVTKRGTQPKGAFGQIEPRSLASTLYQRRAFSLPPSSGLTHRY
ncbi:hypothetical protein HRbin36_02014 [bacterium HR36]|nr:hypothetical protein HRbin36_02014 [bacterium HR36]